MFEKQSMFFYYVTEKLYRMIDARFKTISNEISEKFTKLNSQCNSLSLQIGQLSGKIIEIQHQLTEKNINNTDIEINSDDENAEIKLPCKTKIDFDQFDEKLEKDKNFQKKNRKYSCLKKIFLIILTISNTYRILNHMFRFENNFKKLIDAYP